MQGAAAPPPTVAVAATLEAVAELPRPLDASLAFGPDGRWWHWDGMEATAFHEGRRADEPLSAEALLAQHPEVAPGRPLVIGESLLDASGLRSLPGEIVVALESHPMAHGGYELVDGAWSADGSWVALASRYRPSACCGEDHDHDRSPPHEIVELYELESGEHVELHQPTPLALSSERLLAGSTLYVLRPLHPLDSPVDELPTPRAAAMDPSGTLIAHVGFDDRLRLVRAADGTLLREWSGPKLAMKVAFHPRVPVLAVASEQRLELWRIDGPEPERLAQVALSQVPHALVFDPEGTRLVATGFRPVLARLTLDEQPVGPEPTALGRDLAAPVDAARAWRAERDVDALALSAARVHAYARGRALRSFDLDSGLPTDSWRRRQLSHGVVAASRAPIFAMVEEQYAREPGAATQRLELVDAASMTVLHTLYLPLGEPDALAISPRGSAIAWSAQGDPIVTMRAADGSTPLRMHAGSAEVLAIAISEDDTRMAIASRHVERNVMVGTAGSEEVVVLETPRGVSGLLFSPDGTRLLVADFDGRVHVCDPRAGTRLRTLDPGLGAVGAMAITADGERLVVGHDTTVVVLELASGAELRRHAIAAYLRSLAISADASVIVAGTIDGQLQRLAGR